jgi:hypothetical protein
LGLATACWRCNRQYTCARHTVKENLGEGVVDGLDLVVVGVGALKGNVARKRVVVVQQLPVHQGTQLLTAIALVDALQSRLERWGQTTEWHGPGGDSACRSWS